MKNSFIILIALAAIGCNMQQQQSENGTTTDSVTTTVLSELTVAPAPPDTVKSLSDMKDTVAMYLSPEGVLYKVTLLTESGVAMRSSGLQCDTDIFLGHDRGVAKTTRLTKTYEVFANMNLFRATLQTDSLMRNHVPPVTSDTNSVRVNEEKRNVTISTCYLYAIKRETDNDFHLILGHDTTPTPAELFNVEVSGLPPTTSTSYTTLKAVRDTIENRFGEVCKTSYTLFTPPMKVLVKGSLFYDIDHAPGVVGPLGYRPNTAWEIHPVTTIKFK